MFNWVLFILAIVGFLGYIIKLRSPFSENKLGIFLKYVGGWGLLIGFIVNVFTYPLSVSSNAELEAFYYENFSVYQSVVEQTEEMQVGNGQQPPTVVLETEHMDQAKATSARLKELRDKVAWYNSKIRSKRAYWDTWFLRQWIAEPPADLPFIRLEDKK